MTQKLIVFSDLSGLAGETILLGGAGGLGSIDSVRPVERELVEVVLADLDDFESDLNHRSAFAAGVVFLQRSTDKIEVAAGVFHHQSTDVGMVVKLSSLRERNIPLFLKLLLQCHRIAVVRNFGAEKLGLKIHTRNLFVRNHHDIVLNARRTQLGGFANLFQNFLQSTVGEVHLRNGLAGILFLGSIFVGCRSRLSVRVVRGGLGSSISGCLLGFEIDDVDSLTLGIIGNTLISDGSDRIGDAHLGKLQRLDHDF